MAEYGDEQHAFLVLNGRSKRDKEANSRLSFLNNYKPEPILYACKDTLREVNQWDRYKEFMTKPWRRVFEQKGEAVIELTKEFLASFAIKMKDLDMWDEDAIKFRCGGVWRKTSITQLGIDMGIYTKEEIESISWARARCGFEKEDNRWSGNTKTHAWKLLGFEDETNHVNTSENTALRDPLMMYIHRLLSKTITTRGSRRDAVNLRDLWALFCIKYKLDCNITYLLCQLFRSNEIARDPRTPLFGGEWIYKLYKAYGEDVEGTESLKPIALDMDLSQWWGIARITDMEPLTLRFVNKRGHIWDPKSQHEIMMEEEERKKEEAEYKRTRICIRTQVTDDDRHK